MPAPVTGKVDVAGPIPFNPHAGKTFRQRERRENPAVPKPRGFVVQRTNGNPVGKHNERERDCGTADSHNEVVAVQFHLNCLCHSRVGNDSGKRHRQQYVEARIRTDEK